MPTRIYALIGTVLFGVACSLYAVAQAPASIENDPTHRLKLKNDFVRVFDVLIPAGKASLFHTHLYDGLSIRLSNTKVSEDIVGAANVSTDIRFGEAVFGRRPSPMTHRVNTIGNADFRNIFIELLPSVQAVGIKTVEPLPEGLVKLIDNERIRVSRRILASGESTTPHTHPINGLGVFLSDAKVEITPAGGKAQVIDVKAGNVVWQPAGTSHVIRNVGSIPFESVEVEIR